MTHCIKELIGRLHAEGNAPKRIMFWSDGCKAQYKFKRQFYFVSQPHLNIPEYKMGFADQIEPVTDADGKQKTVRLPISMAHSFFCSCHGKGPSDGETGRCKTKARDLEAGGVRIPLSQNFHDTLKSWMSGVLVRGSNKRGKHSIIRRMFYYVPRGAVKRRRQEQAVDSSSMAGEVTKNHCFMAKGTTGEIRSRLLPCGCKNCWDADGFYSEECTEKEFNAPPKDHALGLTVNTSESDASLEAREERVVAQLEGLRGAVSVVPLYHGKEGEASMGRLFWLADVIDAPFDHAKKKLLRAYMYDEHVVTDGASQRVEYTAPNDKKCRDQNGKCKKRNCKLWHWEPMDAGSVREPMLETARDSRKHFRPVAGKPLTFTLSAGIASGVSDMIAQDDRLYYDTVGTID